MKNLTTKINKNKIQSLSDLQSRKNFLKAKIYLEEQKINKSIQVVDKSAIVTLGKLLAPIMVRFIGRKIFRKKSA